MSLLDKLNKLFALYFQQHLVYPKYIVLGKLEYKEFKNLSSVIEIRTTNASVNSMFGAEIIQDEAESKIEVK